MAENDTFYCRLGRCFVGGTLALLIFHKNTKINGKN